MLFSRRLYLCTMCVPLLITLSPAMTRRERAQCHSRGPLEPRG